MLSQLKLDSAVPKQTVFDYQVLMLSILSLKIVYGPAVWKGTPEEP